ncbi:MFS transporter [Streptomyces heilongjiangensis]|uniref:MFS transporter n=1 Tax=Streptomyces heilongjiangensis TaxID=945052 RepID=A0ABW1B4S4_9ACTN|nr:MFS transporter [Streptomyces heilongjiangensis]MDC2948253.1 MFS transporter [Streptomyces heilongjiangensis]
MELPVRLRQARSALLLIFLVHGAVFALLVTRIPAIQDRYGLSDGELPLALAAVPVLAGVGTVTAARVVRRVPPHVVVRVVQPLICLALAGVGAGEAVWQLAVCLVAFGLLVGAMEASLNMTGVGIQRGYGRSIMLGFHGAASLGGILGAALSWAGAHWHLSLFTVFASSVVMLLPAAVAAGPRLDARPAGTATTSGAPSAAPSDAGTAPARPAGRSGVPWKPLLPLCLIMAVSVVADSTATNWSAKFLEDTLHSSEAMATVPYGLYMVATLLGRALGDGWVQRWGAAAVVRAGAVLAALGFAVVAAAPEPLTAVLGFAVLGVGLSVIIPQALVIGAQRLPGAEDTAVARVSLFNYVGFLVGPPLVGAVGAAVSYRAAMCVPLLLVLGVLLVARSLTAPDPAGSAARVPRPEAPRTTVG